LVWQNASVVSSNGGLQMINISDPCQLTLVADYATGFAPFALEILHEMAYIAWVDWVNYSGGLEVVEHQ
jgi:hypothetical protein